MLTRPASPSWLSVAHYGCRAYLEAYEQREDGPPNDPLADGIDFHRLAEGIQRAVMKGADPNEATEAALDEKGATADVRALIHSWVGSGWLDVSACVGVELGLAVDKSGAIVPFNSPKAHLRGILDRLDIRDDEDTGMRLLEVVDWKGWSGWKRWQAETYALLALCWARENGHDVDGVRVSAWSYRPTTAKVELFDWDVQDVLTENIWFAIEAAQKLRARPVEETRPSGGCSLCPRLLTCGAVWRSLPLLVMTRDEASELARSMAAAKAFQTAAAIVLRPYVEENGPVFGGDQVWGPFSKVKKTIHQPAAWDDIVAHLAPLLGEGVLVDDLVARLAQVAPLTNGTAKTAAKKISGDRDEREALLDSWTREGERRTVGWSKV